MNKQPSHASEFLWSTPDAFEETKIAAPGTNLELETGAAAGLYGAAEVGNNVQSDWDIASSPEMGAGEDIVVGQKFSIYRCDALLGQGGMGKVYLAYHTELARPCALKITSPGKLTRGDDLKVRTAEEARSAAALIHPNIVTVHALGEARGRQYIEMELVAGGSLKHLLRREGPLPTLQALRWMSAIASGMDYAHRQGILHRDIKPENILICGRGVPKLADFGLAHRIGRGEYIPRGFVCGTLPYLAPEVIQTGDHSTATDVYALGVSLYYLLTGRLPFYADSLEDFTQQILTAPCPEVRELRPEIPLNVAGLVSRLMAREASNRPSSGTEAWHLLNSVLGQLRDVQSILDEALGYDPTVSWIRCGEKYCVRVQRPDGRQQRVFIESSEHRSDEQLLLIYSVCCPAESSFYETALRMNAEFSHGGLAIREVDGAPHFVMVDTYPRGTVDSEELRKSVHEIAEHADQVEKWLTGEDRN